MRTVPDSRRLARLALLAGLLAFGPAVSRAADEAPEQPVLPADAWPFGEAGRTSPFQGLDLFNLGLLGAKAGDAAEPRKAPGPVQSGSRSMQVERGGDDAGPLGLRIDVLYPGGPAETAGLRSGDVIVGAGGKAFKKGSLEPLAQALLKAESGTKKGLLTLKVERPGEKKALSLDVPIPQGGKAAADPSTGPGRDRIVDAALKFLAERQLSSGGYPETLSSVNGAVVQTALAGLCWLGAGSDLEHGPYKDNVRSAADFVLARLDRLGSPLGGRPGGTSDRGRGPSWDQSNWGYAHAALFLGELQLRTPDEKVKTGLFTAAEKLVAYQETSGGWAHGPGGPNALGYVELNIVSGLALSGLGLARQCGYEVPEEALQRAETFLMASSAGDGGVGYSERPGQKGMGNIGRTAGCWLGFEALGFGKREWCKKMAAWVRRNVADLGGAHASLLQHVQLSGVAAHALGGAAKKEWWAACGRDFTLARAPDGSFQPRPWHESKGSSNTDVSVGEIWTTACWTLPLVTEASGDRPGLPGWTARRVEPGK